MIEIPGPYRPFPEAARVAIEPTREDASQLQARIGASAETSARALIARQEPAGYWCGLLTADVTLETDYILLELWLHPAEGAVWNPPRKDRILKAARSIRERQLPDGGWNIYSGGPSDVNATARAYAMLKLTGASTEEPALVKARERVLALGGLQAANSYTKINFSLFGLYPRRRVPSVPPEIVLLPGNILYEMSSWTQGDHRAAVGRPGRRAREKRARRVPRGRVARSGQAAVLAEEGPHRHRVSSTSTDS